MTEPAQQSETKTQDKGIEVGTSRLDTERIARKFRNTEQFTVVSSTAC